MERRSDKLRRFLGKRRLLVRGGAVVLGLVVLVLVPGYLGTQPGYFQRFSALDGKHDMWAASAHAEASCQSCHVSPRPLAQAAYRARMVGEFYLSLAMRSREPKVFAKPTNEACLGCHNDLRTVSPKGDLQIPHRAHVLVLKMQCVECHRYLVHELSPEGKNTPPMIACLTCHDGETAEHSCSACHTEKAAPDSHRTASWLVEHADKTADDPACVKCHKWAENWCAECHAHRPKSHGRNWRAVHGPAVKRHRSCEACHDTDFCVKCHGEIPRLNFDPALKRVE